MVETRSVIGFLTLLILLSAIGFSIYMYVYFNSYRTFDLKKEECLPIINRVTGYCQIWDESDKKCYQTEDCVNSSNRISMTKVEKWQIGVLAGLVILFCILLTFYYKY